MNPKPLDQASSPILRGSLPALMRSGQRARELAAHTGTELVVSRNGILKRIHPGPPGELETAQEKAAFYSAVLLSDESSVSKDEIDP